MPCLGPLSPPDQYPRWNRNWKKCVLLTLKLQTQHWGRWQSTQRKMQDCIEVIKLIQTGWPEERWRVQPEALPCSCVRDELVTENGVLLQRQPMCNSADHAPWNADKLTFKQLGLLEPWFVITHTIWTTQQDTVFISDRIGMVVNVQFWDQTFRGTPSSSVKARKNFFLSGFHWRWGSPSERLIPKLNIDYHSYPIANKNCVLLCRSNRVCYHESGF